MRVKLVKQNGFESIELSGGVTVREVATKLKLSKEAIVIKLNDELAHPSTVLKNGDKLEFVNVIYGG